MPVVVAGLVLSFLVMMLFGGTELDRTFLYLAAVRDAPGLRQTALWLSNAAQPQTLLALAAAATVGLALRLRWPEALLLMGTVALGQLLVDMLQALTHDLRPGGTGEPSPVLDSAYPSGAAANATITAFAVAFIAIRGFPARAWALAAAALFALAAGTARLVLGADWPSDVIGGWALGLAWTLLVLLLARVDLGDGTAGGLHHSCGKERIMSENPRTETARRNDDKDLIEGQEEAPAFSLTSGGDLQRDIGTRADVKHEDLGEPGAERVRDKDKGDGDTNLPRFNER